mmetsp:Transcript_11296/g.40060  ORF Transcript_11296/g.40060 Transcript_11296/m.40060 type:complete len:200 (-) Transcript_11296:172-771(-)
MASLAGSSMCLSNEGSTKPRASSPSSQRRKSAGPKGQASGNCSNAVETPLLMMASAIVTRRPSKLQMSAPRCHFFAAKASLLGNSTKARLPTTASKTFRLAHVAPFCDRPLAGTWMLGRRLDGTVAKSCARDSMHRHRNAGTQATRVENDLLRHHRCRPGARVRGDGGSACNRLCGDGSAKTVKDQELRQDTKVSIGKL